MTVSGWEAVLVLALVVGLLARNRVRADVVGLLAMGLVGVLGLVPYPALFGGFANPAVILIASMMVMGEGLQRTGITARIGRWVADRAGGGEGRTAGLLMLAAAIPSALVSDVGVTGIFIRVVEGMRQRLGTPPSRLLMPVAFGAMLGGLLTLLGSSTNILADQFLLHAGHRGLSLFALTPLGAVLVAVGVVYMAFLGRRLLPRREAETDLDRLYGLRQYQGEVRVDPGFSGCGKSLAQLAWPKELGVQVLKIQRRDGRVVAHPGAQDLVEEGDRLWVQGAALDLLRSQEHPGLTLEEEAGFSQGEESHAEALVTPHSPLRGHTLAEVRFRQQYHLAVVAVSRLGEGIHDRLSQVRFRVGDTLILRGSREDLGRLAQGGTLLLQEEVEYQPGHPDRAVLAVATMAAVLLAAAAGWLPVAVAAVLGAAVMVLGGCLTPEEAQHSLELRLLVLIAGMLALGAALDHTGVVQVAARSVLAAAGPAGPLALLAAVYILAGLLTQVLSNAVTVVLVAPLAIQAATTLHLNPASLVVGTVAAVSASPATPFSNQVNLLVMGAGRYRLTDYLRVGLPLALVLFALSLVFIPLLWPFGG
ncbi:MAG: SLC13 family permease [Thermaerobacter sp.]|nr:SLC13 family permease [Thermaerobacter sp.]